MGAPPPGVAQRDGEDAPEFELKTVKTNMSAIGHRPHRDFLETLGVLQQAVKLRRSPSTSR